MSPQELPVVVIGAGPVGMSAAVQLLDRNVDVVASAQSCARWSTRASSDSSSGSESSRCAKPKVKSRSSAFGMVPRTSSAASIRSSPRLVQATALLGLVVSHGAHEFDEAFGARDEEWDSRTTAEAAFRDAILHLKSLLEQRDSLRGTRLRNQVDFYSLIGSLTRSPTPEFGA